MPYLDSPARRGQIARDVEDMHVGEMDSAELNFTLCTVFNEYVRGERRYWRFANVFGSTILALLEFWRRVVVPYEQQKARENGDLPWPV